jgi:hypothetical protein
MMGNPLQEDHNPASIANSIKISISFQSQADTTTFV